VCHLSPPSFHATKKTADNLGAAKRRHSSGAIDGALIDAERQSVFGLLCFLDCRVDWGPSTTALSIEGFTAAIALDIHLQDRGVMDKAIDGRKRHSLVTEHRRILQFLIGL
jgi:hypothetical protein